MLNTTSHTAGLTYDDTNFNVVDELYRKQGLRSFNNTKNKVAVYQSIVN